MLVLRALAEGRIRWAFWPPGTNARVVEQHQGGVEGAGIWVPDSSGADHDIVAVSDDEITAPSSEERNGSDTTEDESEEEAVELTPALVGGAPSRFAALSLEDEDLGEGEE